MSNIIDSIKLSGVTYTIQGSGGGGNPTVELTQAQYDALVTAGTVQADTYYIITDASAGDLSNYMSSAQTMSAITEATSGKVDSNVYTAYTASTDTAIQGKQDTLVSGTNIKTINNESLLGSGNITIQGGGGKTVSGGTNISITTGETADTINCKIPYSDVINGNTDIILGKDMPSVSDYNRVCYGKKIASRANSYFSYSIGIGVPPSVNSSDYNELYGSYSIGIGGFKIGNGSQYSNFVNGCVAIGYGAKTRINGAVAIGKDTEASGTTKTNINNQLSIDTSNQVYIYNKDNTEMICLQDHLGGGNVPESRLNLLHGYGTSGGTDLFSWSTGSTSQVINEYVAFSKINNTSIICGKNTSPTNFSLVETSAITTSITSSSTDAQVPSAKCVYDTLGGLKLVKLTQTEYDNLSTKDSNTLYVIVN